MKARLKVVVADDEKQLGQLLKIQMESVGYSVFTATGGMEAFDLVKKVQPDVVISDLRMPEGNGLDLLRRIKNSPFSHCMVILMSGFTDSNQKEVMEAGAFAFVKKPFNFKKIYDVIESTRSEKS